MLTNKQAHIVTYLFGTGCACFLASIRCGYAFWGCVIVMIAYTINAVSKIPVKK